MITHTERPQSSQSFIRAEREDLSAEPSALFAYPPREVKIRAGSANTHVTQRVSSEA